MSNTLDPEDPQVIYDALILRCKEVKAFLLCFYVEESWVHSKPIPFRLLIRDGRCIAKVIAKSKIDAQILVADHLPVIKFLEIDFDDDTKNGH